ncbi:MAG TPA: hypothetical protein VIS74_07195 [Chthoniobacterales bacterium]
MPQDHPTKTIFSGVFERALDEKNRVTIPAKWMTEGEACFYLAPGAQKKFLMVLPPAEFIGIENRIMEGSTKSLAEKRAAVQHFQRATEEANVDKQGRMLLPERLTKEFDLSKDVMLIGNKERFEIWNTQKWQEFEQANAAIFEAVAEEIGL